MTQNPFYLSFLEYLQSLNLSRIEHDNYEPLTLTVNEKIIFFLLPKEYSKAYTSLQKSDLRQIYIHEDEWYSKQKIIISRLNSIFGKTIKIHGRATQIVSLTKPEITAFLEKNHLNVPTIGKYKYGLLHKGELVSAMTFSKSCPIDRGEKRVISYNLFRFSHKLNHTVVGGFSKLLNHFIKEHNPQDIVTYVDKEWSDGHAYEQFGFRFLEETEPLVFYLDPNTNIRYTENQLPDRDTSHFIKIKNIGNIKLVLERY